MIRYLEDGKIDLSVLEIVDIIDLKVLQSFQDNYAIGMKVASVTVDRKGEPVTKPSSYVKFCDCYVHKSSIGDARCAVSHNRMGQEALAMGKPFIGPCHAGLIDFAAPVIVEGELLGTVLGGQILDSPPDENHFKKIAREIHVEEDALVDSVKEIDVVLMKNIEAAAWVLYLVVNALATNGFQRIQVGNLSARFADNFIQVSDTLEDLAQSALTITTKQQDLSKHIEEIKEVTSEISSVLQSIAKIADKTKLIGLNASIEAARLGNDGLGFSVVANEIRSLSESSKQTAQYIVQLNSKIGQYLDNTIHNSKETLETTEDQSAAMEELSATVQDMLQKAEELKELA